MADGDKSRVPDKYEVLTDTVLFSLVDSIRAVGEYVQESHDHEALAAMADAASVVGYIIGGDGPLPR